MEKGIIYLIQPSELIGTSVFKIGYSGKTSLERCYNGYKKGSRYLCINECVNPTILENKIKKDFNNKFKLIAGKEYFEGDEENIKLLFRKLVEEHEKELQINKEEINDKLINKILNNNDIELNIQDDKLKCNYCNKVFSSSQSRSNHYNIKHKEEHILHKTDTKNKCVKCNKELSCKQSKYRHEKKCIMKYINKKAEENKIYENMLKKIIQSI
jgi:hypothetical protein